MCYTFIDYNVYWKLVVYLQLFLHIDPEKIYPPQIKAFANDDAKFTCYSNGRTYWHHNDHALVIGVGKTFYIKDVQAKNAGYYECRGLTENDQEFMARSQLLLLSIK